MILDSVDNLELSDNEARKYSNELKSLRYLEQGLDFLYRQVLAIESTVPRKLPDKLILFSYGNYPLLKDVPQGLVASAFHWYAVSVCNYIRLVGWLVYRQNSNDALNYLKRVAPNVKIWRDKVGAHFARVKPSKKDTSADLAMSVMFPISFEDDAFYAGSLVLKMTSSDKTSTSRKDMRWSLTHTHRALIPRYWQMSIS